MTLRFLADESCDFAVIRALRAERFDVLAVSEYMTRSDDRQLIEQAAPRAPYSVDRRQGLWLLVYVSHADSAGVILLRYPSNRRANMARAVVQVVQERGEALVGSFVVMQPGHVRIGRRP